MENDYKNSVIYRIYCKNPDITECYKLDKIYYTNEEGEIENI